MKVSINPWGIGSKKEVILEVQRHKRKVSNVESYVTWKMLELEKKSQKYKGRVELRDNIVKDDSDAYAVFTE